MKLWSAFVSETLGSNIRDLQFSASAGSGSLHRWRRLFSPFPQQLWWSRTRKFSSEKDCGKTCRTNTKIILVLYTRIYGYLGHCSVLFRIQPWYLEGIFAFKMEDIVSELNFDEGIAMPVANLENKQLESEVRFSMIK